MTNRMREGDDLTLSAPLNFIAKNPQEEIITKNLDCSQFKKKFLHVQLALLVFCYNCWGF